MSGGSSPAGHGERTAWLADEVAFSAFYRGHAEALLVFFTRRTYDVEGALDLTAETFAQAFAARRRFRGGSDAQAGAWLLPSPPPNSLRTCAAATRSAGW